MILSSMIKVALMEDIKIIKLGIDMNCIILKVFIQSKFVTAFQTCYVEDVIFKDASDRILNFINKRSPTCQITFGELGGNYTPSLDMVMTQDKRGHVVIDITMELNDGAKPKHPCCFYLNTELGLLEKFASAMNYLVNAPEDTEISLLNGI